MLPYFFRKICIVSIVILCCQVQLANARVSAAISTAKLLKGVSHIDEVANLVKLPYADVVKVLRTYPKTSQSQLIIKMAVHKGLVTNADSIKILTTLQKNQHLKPFSIYQGELLKYIHQGTKFNSTLVAKQIQQIRNGGLAGTKHAASSVTFGKYGYPIFESLFEVKLPKNLYQMRNTQQFNYANKMLKKALINTPSIATKFPTALLKNIDQLGSSKFGNLAGYTWHHHEHKGLLQLVRRDVHENLVHRGGRSIWGRGSQKQIVQ